ncbi:uncharacterized protein LOC585408 isoform X2 [Strongylocentrotus purpuratus]|uniref:Uncharacterized protein n=1 Tax=Strongylocentrotus purpuratus TaxID=7668 RepID=A0A7M7NHF9_STRPU|nr:uncharacterized protein LOC585408 isoform X2 [Strongylocentrotus purpuratus]
MQQPPPRKAKIGQDLKNIQHDQWTKLQSKHQSDSELLEDVRDFAKQRAAIEKVYAQSLQKLSTHFVQKRTFPPPSEGAEEQRDRTVLQVWKALLDETEKIGRVRLTASESISTQIIDTIKIQKNTRTNTLKKCGDLTNAWHEEVQASVRELIKARKNYADAEKIAQDARGKAAEAENRLTKGSVKFFQSRSSLEKTTAKLMSRRTTCDRRAAHMRNEYLLCLAAANTHRKRLHETDVPFLMEALDGDFYERLRNHFRVFSTTEIESSTYVKSCFQIISDEADMIFPLYLKRCHQQQKFLKENPIFTDIVQYVYDPVENDEVSNLIMDNTESLYLEREARRWATQVAKESNHIESLTRQMEACQPFINQLRGSDNSSDSGFSQDKDPEVKLDTLREARRKAETNKLKAEAKLDVMRNAGIDVEEWLNSAYEAIAKEAEIEAQTMLQQQHSQQEQQHSLVEQQHYEASHEELDDGDDDHHPQHAPHVRELHSYSITSFDSVDDFDQSYDDQVSQGSSGHSISSKNPSKCTAIFDYTAQRDDELTIRLHDVLELIEESEGDGWLKARNQHGDMGYVPENYIEVEKQQRLSFSTSPKGDAGGQQQPGQVLGHASSQSSMDYEVQAVMGIQGSGEDSGRPAICMVRALYDYAGSCQEELSFVDGTIFKLLRRDENGIDDGFWEGELNGKIGVFPSLLVEELNSESRQSSNDSKSKSRSRPKYRPHRCVPSIIIDDAHCSSNDSWTCSSEDSYAVKPSSRSFFSNQPPPHSRRPPQRTSPRHPIAARKANRNSVGRSIKKAKKVEYKKGPKKGTHRYPASPSQNPIPMRKIQDQSKRPPKLIPSRKSPSAPKCKECIQSARKLPPLPEPRRDPVEMGSHNKWFRIQSTDDTVLKASGLVPHPRAPPQVQQFSQGALDRTKSPSLNTLNSNMNQSGGVVHYEVLAEQINKSKSKTLTRAKSCWDCKESQPCRCRPQLPLPLHTYHDTGLQRPDQHRQPPQRQRHNQAPCTPDPQRQGPYRQDPHRRDPQRRDPQRQDPHRRDPHRRDPQRQDPQRQDQRRRDPQRQDQHRRDPQRQDQHRRDPQRQDQHRQDPQRQNQRRRDPQRRDPQRQDQRRQDPQRQDQRRQDPQKAGHHIQDFHKQEQKRQNDHRRDPQRQDLQRQDPHRQGPHRQDQHVQEQNILNHHRQGPCKTDPHIEVRLDQQKQNSYCQLKTRQDLYGEDPHRQDPHRQEPQRQDPQRQNTHSPDLPRQDLHIQELKRQNHHRQDPQRQDQHRQEQHRPDPHREDPHRHQTRLYHQLEQDQSNQLEQDQATKARTSQDQSRLGQHSHPHGQEERIKGPQGKDQIEQDESRDYVNGPEALGSLQQEIQKQEIHRQGSEVDKKQALNESKCNGGPKKETAKHGSSTEDQSEEDKALRKLRFLNSRKSLEQKFSTPVLNRETETCVSDLKDKETEDNNRNKKNVHVMLETDKNNRVAISNRPDAEATIQTSCKQSNEGESCSQENVTSLSGVISKEVSKGQCGKKKTTFSFANQKREGRKLSASFNIGKSSARSLREEKRATSIPDLSLLEGMYSTRIGPPISPRTESLIKKPPPHGILKQSQSLDYRKIKGPPYSLDSLETKSMSNGPKRDHSCPERLSDFCTAVVEEEEEEVKGRPHIDQYARVARNRQERSKVKAQGCRQETQEAMKSPMGVERRSASLDEACQDDLDRSRNQDRKSSCPTASLIFHQRQKESISPPNYRKANTLNSLAVTNNKRVSSRVISPTLERHLRNLNSFWSQNRASVVVNGPHDPSSTMPPVTPPRRESKRSNSLCADSLFDDGKQRAIRSRSCSPTRNRQSVLAFPIQRDPLRSSNIPSYPTTSTTTSTPTTPTSTALAPSASRSPCTSPRNSPRLSRKQARYPHITFLLACHGLIFLMHLVATPLLKLSF